jgi:predicted DNA-binding transcriptional regulator AlpA
MNPPPIDFAAVFLRQPELAAVAVFALLGLALGAIGWARGAMTPAPGPKVAKSVSGDPDRLQVLDPTTLAGAVQGSVPRLLWGWPEILTATGIPRSTLERLIASGKFPKPVVRVSRPYWRPCDVIRWAEGGKP